MDTSALLQEIKRRDPHHVNFQQAAASLLKSVSGYLDDHPELLELGLLDRLLEPAREIRFRVPWVDDQGRVRVNRAYRVQMKGARAPIKGGFASIRRSIWTCSRSWRWSKPSKTH